MFTPANLTPPEQIQKELEDIQAFLEAPYSADVPGQVQARFDSLAAYMARSGKIKADAEYHYNNLLNASIGNALDLGLGRSLSPSTLNKFVESAARNYKYLLTWADRINRSCTHQLDSIRSVMSTLRSERFSTYGK